MPEVKDYFVIQGQGQYLVTDWVIGKKLVELLVEAGGSLPEYQAVEIIEQICQALEYLNSLNPPVLHREITAADIILTTEGRVMLVDFGIVRAFDPSKQTSYNSQNDVYTLGVALYTLLTGHIPPERMARADGIDLALPRQLNSSITPPIESVVLKALEVRTESRYQTVGELEQALRVPPTAKIIPPQVIDKQYSLQSWNLRRPSAAILGSIAALLVLVVVVAGLISLITGRIDEQAVTQTINSKIRMTSAYETWAPVTENAIKEKTHDALARKSQTAAFNLTDTSLSAETQTAVVHASLAAEMTAVAKLVPEGMALVPAGEFEMGAEDASIQSEADEKPQHIVFLDAFYIDIYEVSNARYSECVNSGACEPPGDQKYFNDPSYSQHPVVFMDWFQSQAYCEWRGRSLPSEAQWEKAARGGVAGRFYPWGSSNPDCALTNFWGKAGGCVGGPSPVGSYSSNNFGLYDMAGNVWEWVLDWYQVTFYSISPSSNPIGPESGFVRVVRSGSWGNSSVDIRISNRNSHNPDNGDSNTGFRCVSSL